MNSTFSPSEIMTIADVVQLLDLHRSTIHRMCERGKITGYKFGKRVYFRRSEILAAVTANPTSRSTEESTQAA